MISFRLLSVLLVLCAASVAGADDAPPRVRCVETDDAILVTVGGKNVLRYNKATRESPAGIDPVYRRSGHIHPIYSPDGEELTGDFPADHPHQHALFFAWRFVNFEGREISFWDQLAQTGRTSHANVVSTESGADSGRFVVELLHEDLTAPGGPKPVLRETWTVEVHDRGDDVFVFDLTSQQRCAGDAPVGIPQYHYGGLSIRGRDGWYSDKAQATYSAWEKSLKQNPDAPRPAIDVMRHDFLTSEGQSQYAGNHSRPRWVDLFGPVGDGTAGIAILCHPDNFRAPQPVRLHPSKPYFCFSPMVLDDFEITPGETYVSRYRFVVHRGAPQPEAIDAEWQRLSGDK